MTLSEREEANKKNFIPVWGLRSLAHYGTCRGGVLFPVDAHPEDSLIEFEAEMVRFNRDVPGELTIDATDPYTAFPTPSEVLSFANWEEYAEFLEEMFNLVRHVGEDGQTVALEASWIMIGEPWALSPDMTDVMPVTDPISTLVGGLSGTVDIGGTTHCVNSDRCENAVSPLALGPVQITEVEENDTSVETVAPASTVMASPPKFSISKYSSYRENFVQDYLGNPLGHLLEIASNTAQDKGGYNRFEGHVIRDAVEVCGPDAGLPDYLCVYYPALFYLSRGENFLSVKLTTAGNRLNLFGQCFDYSKTTSGSGTNVPSITVGQSYLVRYLPFRVGCSPSHARGEHLGVDVAYGTVDMKTSYLPVPYPPMCS